MKITKTKLRQIIKEEIEQLAQGRSNISLSSDQAQKIRQTQNRAQKIIKFLTSNDPDNVNQGLTILDSLEDQQLIDAIASHIVFRPGAPGRGSSNRITIRGFKIPNETLEMILRYFAEKSVHVKNMLAQIENLNFSRNNFITNVDFLSFCTNLMRLNLSYCRSLENVDGLEGCMNLTGLALSFCKSLQNVDGLEGCTNLTSLILRYCESLQNVDGLKSCTNLKTLSLSDCISLQNVDGLAGCTNLTNLYLGGCESLQNVDVLVGCTNLTSLDLSDCYSLPPELQKWFVSDGSDTAYEQFMEALNASKRNSL